MASPNDKECKICGKKFTGSSPAVHGCQLREHMKQWHSPGREIKELAKDVHQVAVNHGWTDNRTDGEMIALMHSELSEALEYCREDPAAPSDHIPEFTGVEEEMADVIIRVLDFCEARELRIAEALLAKNEFNKNRPYKHGGKKF